MGKPEAGRAWKGGDGGGPSLRCRWGAQGNLSQAVALRVQRKGGRKPAEQAIPGQSWEAAPAFRFGPLVASSTSDRLGVSEKLVERRCVKV